MPPELQQETLKRLPEEMQETYELFRQNLEPVSYTHLDVYKRQIQHTRDVKYLLLGF